MTRPKKKRSTKKSQTNSKYVKTAKRGTKMADYPPFMNAYGRLKTILEKIKEAKTPDRFTLDFLSTKLGAKGGSAAAFIPVAKRIGFLNSDGTPTEIYRRFRNSSESRIAMADAIRKGYSELFSRNEYVYELDKKKLDGLLVELTGLEEGNTTLGAIRGTFETLKGFADFEGKSSMGEEKEIPKRENSFIFDEEKPQSRQFGMGLQYNINLVLPQTEDIAVFNAIFKSLRENLLEK